MKQINKILLRLEFINKKKHPVEFAINFIKEQDKEINKIKNELSAYDDLLESREQRIRELSDYKFSSRT